MKDTLIQEILSLLSDFSPGQIQAVRDAVRMVLCNYEVSEKTTALQPLDNSSYKYLNLYLAACEQSGKSPDTIVQYRFHIFRMLSYINKNVTDITDDDLFLYMYQYRHNRSVSNGYLDNIRLVLNRFFSWLIKKRIVTKNPVDSIEPIKAQKKIKRPLSPTDMEHLRAACQHERDLAIIECLYSSAVRASELLQLNRSDVSFSNNGIIILGKGNKERITYLNAKSHVHLQKYLESRTDSNPALFVSANHPHARLTRNGLEDIVRKIGAKAGIKEVHPHRFRRTSATDLLNVGMPIEQVQELLGHKSIETTRIYCTVTQESVRHNHQKFMNIA